MISQRFPARNGGGASGDGGLIVTLLVISRAVMAVVYWRKVLFFFYNCVIAAYDLLKFSVRVRAKKATRKVLMQDSRPVWSYNAYTLLTEENCRYYEVAVARGVIENCLL